MSAAIGASAAGARAYTATASQGLLYMVEALYNASGLGLPIVMTVANRAIGAPINIWNDHSDSDVPARFGMDPALCRVQPGGARPPHPSVQARRGAVASGDGVHGRVHPHPRLRAGRRAGQEQVDSFLPPFEPRQVLDPADPVTIGAMVGPEAFFEVKYLMHAKQMQALDADPARSPPSSRASSAESPAAWSAATAPRTPRRSWSRWARSSARSRTSVDELREQGVKIGAVAIKCFRPYPLEEVREALRRREADRGAREGVRRRRRRDRGPEREACALGPRARGLRRGRRASAAGRSPSSRSTALFADVLEDRLEAGRCTSSTSTASVVERELERMRERRPAPGPHAENILRDMGIVAARSH